MRANFLTLGQITAALSLHLDLALVSLL
jgi:hypothetical protein